MDTLETILLKTKLAYNEAAQTYYDLFYKEMETKEHDRKLLDTFAGKFTSRALVCDAGCGPCGHIAQYLGHKNLHMIGIDISPSCIFLARWAQPQLLWACGDMAHLPFADSSIDGVVSYYSIIDTPKQYVPILFNEFYRVLKPGGYLLIAVKAGHTEGYIHDLLGMQTEIYFTLFSETEIQQYFLQAGFQIDFLEKRNPYDFEIKNQRIFAIGKKMKERTKNCP